MIRRAPDGRQSLIGLIAAWTHTTRQQSGRILQSLTKTGVVPHYETKSFRGKPTPFVTEDEWAMVRRHIRVRTDDLYVMRYSTAADTVKIGRSRDVELRRRSLEVCQNFYVTLVACFPGHGHMEATVHNHLQPFRSRAGAGREWFNVTGEQAVVAIRWCLENHQESPSPLVARELPE